MSWWTDAERRLEGEPDAVLTVGLVLVAVVLVIAAWRAPRLVKAGMLAWVLLP